MRKPDGKYLLAGIGVGILFDIVLQGFYNLLRHDELLPYDSVGGLSVGSVVQHGALPVDPAVELPDNIPTLESIPKQTGLLVEDDG